jgi:exopolysaccharide production protein ExoY
MSTTKSLVSASLQAAHAGRHTTILERGPFALGELLYGLTNQLAALLLIMLFGPLMLWVALRIRAVDGSPIVFAHYRVGKRGKLFRCFKFRTMVKNADSVLGELLLSDPVAKAQWDRDQKLEVDPRITPVGHFLRKTSLDELPQLFNVLRGEMNLVGPRPIVVQELMRYGAAKRHYLSVRPGMTGLWQVSGRNLTTYEHRVALDRRYALERSAWFDFVILLKTVRVVLTGHGAR